MPSDGRGSSPGIFSMIMAFLTGGSMNKLVLQEGAAPAVGTSGTDVIYADSTAHTLKVSLNGAGFVTLGGATAPLTLTGSTDARQLTVIGNATQTYTNPVVDIQNSAGNSFIKFGYNLNGAANFGGILWLGTAPNAGNTSFSIAGDGTDIIINAPTGLIKLRVANAGGWTVSSSGILASAGATGFYGGVDGVMDAYRNDGSTVAWMRNLAGTTRSAVATTNNTANMAVVSNMAITLLAGHKYSGIFTAYAKNSTAAEGIQFDFAGGNATFTSIEFGFAATPPGAGIALGTLTSTATNAAVPITATTATTADAIYSIPVTLVCNAAGTFIPRFAEVSHSLGTVTVELGSSLTLEDYN